ncbi:hypothetical protein ACFFK0_27870 [Paenibacillus chartarius]|uniref:Uncharacterized protein n=1 Tax=Paenibacillus chartarius TaxID=747481 RepID=A0ABV6DU82_9BACL
MFRKKMFATVVAAILLSALVIPAASPAPAAADSAISIVEDLPLYEEASRSSAVAGTISPQQVQVLAEQTVSKTTWYQISTWLGPKWIAPLLTLGPNTVMTDSFTVELRGEERLYKVPDEKQPTKDTIGAQSVKVDAYAELLDNYGGKKKAYRIDTWLGKRWIIPQGPHIPFLYDDARELKLEGPTLLFDSPAHINPFNRSHYSLLKIDAMLAPQTVRTLKRYTQSNNGAQWYEIDTYLGPKWIDLSLPSLPQIQVEKKAYSLKRITAAYNYPSDYATYLFALAPQEVESYETAGEWIHIHTTFGGDAWVRIKEPEQGPDSKYRMNITGQIDQVGNQGIILYEVSGSRNASRFNMEGYVALNQSVSSKIDVTLKLRFIHEDGREGEVHTVTVNNMGAGELRYFYINTGAINTEKTRFHVYTYTTSPASLTTQSIYDRFHQN